MLKFRIILMLVLLTVLKTASAGDQEAFNEICRIYTETKNSSMDIQTASQYVFDNISKRVKSKNALITHEAVMEAMHDQRYIIFKESAEHYIKSSWNCKAMKDLMEVKTKKRQE